MDSKTADKQSTAADQRPHDGSITTAAGEAPTPVLAPNPFLEDAAAPETTSAVNAPSSPTAAGSPLSSSAQYEQEPPTPVSPAAPASSAAQYEIEPPTPSFDAPAPTSSNAASAATLISTSDVPPTDKLPLFHAHPSPNEKSKRLGIYPPGPGDVPVSPYYDPSAAPPTAPPPAYVPQPGMSVAPGSAPPVAVLNAQGIAVNPYTGVPLTPQELEDIQRRERRERRQCCGNALLVVIIAIALSWRKSIFTIACHFLLWSFPRAILIKLLSLGGRFTTPAQRLLGATNERSLSLDAPTYAVIETMRWALLDTTLETTRSFFFLTDLVQVGIAKYVEGVKMARVQTSAGEKRGAVEGYWIAERVEEIPTGYNTAEMLESTQVLLFFHGGGYNANSARAFSNHHARLIRVYNAKAKAAGSPTRLVVFSCEYPLAPEHPYPAALHAAVDAVKWITDEVGAKDIVIGGDSAGGNLCISLLNKLSQQADLRSYAEYISASLLFSPWVDITGTVTRKGFASFDVLHPQVGRAWATGFAGGLKLHDPRLSPYFLDVDQIATARKGTFISHGGLEIFAPAIEEFIKKMKEAKAPNLVVHKADDMPHDYQ
ncbi:hypothetical protein HDU96_001572 [Phlyctochytrium bullatum]|nr:hypothetical protein HDU96_001572 [Phlyctochytrium bullatum]